VDAVYNNILRHSRNEVKARKILHIVVAAARPLSLKEMNVAYAIESSDSSDLQNRLQPSIESTVRGICGLFVKVVDKKFYLVHQTAILESILEACDTRSKRFMTWLQVYWTTVSTYSWCPQGFTELTVGSYFGHETVVQLLLDKGAAVDAKDDRCGAQ
jgi:hypothetical protein